VRAHHLAGDLVVADHGVQLDGQLTQRHPAQQIVQAVQLLAHQHHHALQDAGVGDRPRGVAQIGGDSGEPFPQLVDTERQ
jgi:hypothetical protein